MPSLQGTQGCCGAAELFELEDFARNPKRFWKELHSTWEGHSFREYTTIIFSDNTINKDGGLALAEWIKTKRFGTVLSHRALLNPKSRNNIKVWIWNPNEAAKSYINR